MILRTLFTLSSLYAWGSPMLDTLRPHQIDFMATTVREVLEPSVNAAGSIAWNFIEDYVPPEVRQIRTLGGPLAQLDDAFAQTGKRY